MPRGGMLDAPSSNLGSHTGSSPVGAAIYVDDASGRAVGPDWWPGDPIEGDSMSLIDEARIKADLVKAGHWTAYTIHELADYIHKLIAELEGSHGDQDQAQPQRPVAQEVGSAAGSEDSGVKAGGREAK